MARKSSPSVIKRFRGRYGKERLAETLVEQTLLSASTAAARALAECARVVELSRGMEIMTQGGQDNDLYFIISGSVCVTINNREVATRRAGDGSCQAE